MAAPPARVRRAVEATLGCAVLSCEQPADGRIAETYLLELDGEPERAVCKIGGPSVRTGEVIEPLAVGLAKATTDIPAPSVLASGTFDGETGFRSHWALYEFRDGHAPTPFDTIESGVRRRIVHQTGSILGRLHDTHQFERVGGLGRNGGTLCIRSPNGLNFPEQGRRLAQLHSASPADWQPVLSHGDLFPGNLLVADDGTITGLLDWGNAHVTTAGYALARAEMRFIDWFRLPAGEQRRLRVALRDGYLQHRELPSDYPALASLYKAAWLAQSADRILRHLTSRRGRQQLRRHLHSLVP
jgi:aminoglycoside phosphotransferase (APT) family kinase protein